MTDDEIPAFLRRFAHALSTADRATALTLGTAELDHHGVFDHWSLVRPDAGDAS